MCFPIYSFIVIVIPFLLILGLVIQPARFGEKNPFICRHHNSTCSNTSAMVQSPNFKSVTVCNAHFDESSKLVALMTKSWKHYSIFWHVMSEFKQPLQKKSPDTRSTIDRLALDSKQKEKAFHSLGITFECLLNGGRGRTSLKELGFGSEGREELNTHTSDTDRLHILLGEILTEYCILLGTVIAEAAVARKGDRRDRA